jgi:hypothetical protein
MATTPISNLSTASQPWGRDVEDRLKTLENTVNRLDINSNAAITQLNSIINSNDLSTTKFAGAVQALSNAKVYSGIDPARPTGATNAVVTLTFQKPSWATTANVIASGEIGALGSQPNSETIGGYVHIDIDGTRPRDTNAPAGVEYEYYKTISNNGSTMITYVPMFFARTFVCNSSYYTVSMLFDKNATVWSTFTASINAIVYWTA